ncbi:MAG: hypothetical protein OYH77_06445 [Pseudomonadota bacterium]|nr:hypothetical protein [Pseudomonadota bacterium]
MHSKKIINPIAIDLGAKHTGVFTAQYQAGHELKIDRGNQINQCGYVYNLEKDKFTLLMVKRTQARHQRRGYDRRQMVKRLFRVIWEKHFKLEWNSDVQQTISFLLNRRGFSFISGDYDAAILSQFPSEAYDLLPDELKNGVHNDGDCYDFNSALQAWSRDTKTLQGKLNAITNYQQKNKGQLPIWNFKISDFKLDKKINDFDNEKKSIKTHLYHLTYAVHKTHEEITNGARHRSKYFDEISKVLDSKRHTHGYLKNFQAKLSTGKFDNLDADRLTNLIGNLSNLELKPLRKYFNDIKHAKADYWDTDRFNEFYFKWICKQWRVNPDKDKDKADDANYDYGKLKDMCRKSSSAIEFLLTTDSNWTIPPYQDNNNRQPPCCQSLILNPKFLDDHYSNWQAWLQKLTKISEVEEYLGAFIPTLKELKTGSLKEYFHNKDKDLNARALQFIFDRAKASDLALSPLGFGGVAVAVYL